jgi:hypothetical protein
MPWRPTTGRVVTGWEKAATVVTLREGERSGEEMEVELGKEEKVVVMVVMVVVVVVVVMVERWDERRGEEEKKRRKRRREKRKPRRVLTRQQRKWRRSQKGERPFMELISRSR